MIKNIEYFLSKLSFEAVLYFIKRIKREVGLLAFLLIILPAWIYAQDEFTTDDRLAEISETVERYRLDLEDKQKKQKGLEDSYNKVKQEARVIAGKQASLKNDYETAKAKLDTFTKEIELASDNIESVERRYASRIRALYMQRSQDLLESVFLISDQTTLKRNAYFMSRIKASDQKIMEDLYNLKKDKNQKIEAMQKALKQKEELSSKVEKENKLLSAKLTEQENIMKEFNKEKVGLEQTIASLKAQSLRIETVVTSITGKEKGLRRASKSGLIKKSQESKLEAFSGAGLEKLKGQLNIPVSGASLDSAAGGPVTIGRVMSGKGLTYNVSPASEVKAVAEGKVIFNSTMPGRGKMVIIDHGQRFYSLYARLSKSKVENQQVVETGQSLGLTEEPSEGEAQFYFEIRKNGIAVDTKSYLKRQ